MQELAAASQHLAELAGRLDSLAARFRTSTDGETPQAAADRHGLLTTLRATVRAGR